MPIPPNNYLHPEDQAALENLKSIPLFTQCVQAFMKVYSERVMHGMAMAQHIRLGPSQLPEIYAYLPPICERLGIAVPDLFLEMNPAPNAYTAGDSTIYISVTSGLLEYLDADEVRAVLAHECGHIACRHVLYHTMAQLLITLGPKIFGPLATVSMPVQLALLYWMRRSEFSADRAAAVAMGDSAQVVETMIRLAGGPRSLTGAVNVEEYIRQADEFDQLQESQWDKLILGLNVMYMSHPLLAVRTREIIRWCEGDHFCRLIQCADAMDAGGCAACGAPLEASWKFCRRCGAANPQCEVTTHV